MPFEQSIDKGERHVIARRHEATRNTLNCGNGGRIYRRKDSVENLLTIPYGPLITLILLRRHNHLMAVAATLNSTSSPVSLLPCTGGLVSAPALGPVVAGTSLRAPPPSRKSLSTKSERIRRQSPSQVRRETAWDQKNPTPSTNHVSFEQTHCLLGRATMRYSSHLKDGKMLYGHRCGNAYFRRMLSVGNVASRNHKLGSYQDSKSSHVGGEEKREQREEEEREREREIRRTTTPTQPVVSLTIVRYAQHSSANGRGWLREYVPPELRDLVNAKLQAGGSVLIGVVLALTNITRRCLQLQAVNLWVSGGEDGMYFEDPPLRRLKARKGVLALSIANERAGSQRLAHPIRRNTGRAGLIKIFLEPGYTKSTTGRCHEICRAMIRAINLPASMAFELCYDGARHAQVSTAFISSGVQKVAAPRKQLLRASSGQRP
ncbi:hypothetical protein EAG_09116 [Camponotus floridanus]|uniref:Uncharacterized protein n=1 Tax=Camponotus floridanus TaxID=104421 RepID=E2AHC5_CAMFO|nr:hypothetical protein EAG_09116 [Camponotus floridanus]